MACKTVSLPFNAHSCRAGRKTLTCGGTWKRAASAASAVDTAASCWMVRSSNPWIPRITLRGVGLEGRGLRQGVGVGHVHGVGQGIGQGTTSPLGVGLPGNVADRAVFIGDVRMLARQQRHDAVGRVADHHVVVGEHGLITGHDAGIACQIVLLQGHAAVGKKSREIADQSLDPPF